MNKRVIEIVQQWNDFLDKVERHGGICAGGSIDYGNAGRSTKKSDPVAGKADTLRKIPITDAERTSYRIMQELPHDLRQLLTSFVASSDSERCRKGLRELSREAGYTNVEDYKAARKCAEVACLYKDQKWNPASYFKPKDRESRELSDTALAGGLM